ncbi:MAG: LPXTG cell wall anchor domain-containing protein, partial [Candidatus Dormibacteraceae bacterium]
PPAGSGANPGSGGGSASGGGSTSGGATGTPVGGVSPTPAPASSEPQTVVVKDVRLAASTGDGLAWPGALGGSALFLGLVLLLLARRRPRDPQRPR